MTTQVTLVNIGGVLTCPQCNTGYGAGAVRACGVACNVTSGVTSSALIPIFEQLDLLTKAVKSQGDDISESSKSRDRQLQKKFATGVVVRDGPRCALTGISKAVVQHTRKLQLETHHWININKFRCAGVDRLLAHKDDIRNGVLVAAPIREMLEHAELTAHIVDGKVILRSHSKRSKIFDGLELAIQLGFSDSPTQNILDKAVELVKPGGLLCRCPTCWKLVTTIDLDNHRERRDSCVKREEAMLVLLSELKIKMEKEVEEVEEVKEVEEVYTAEKTANEEKEPTAFHAYFTGDVQGYHCRVYVVEKAQELRLTGWVRNLFDKRVEIRANGEKKCWDELVARFKLKFNVTDIEYAAANDDKTFKVFQKLQSTKEPVKK